MHPSFALSEISAVEKLTNLVNHLGLDAVYLDRLVRALAQSVLKAPPSEGPPFRQSIEEPIRFLLDHHEPEEAERIIVHLAIEKAC
jgi:hypothetical protein